MWFSKKGLLFVLALIVTVSCGSLSTNVSANAGLSSSPSSLNFGSVSVNTTGTATVTLTNGGHQGVTILRASATLPQFAVAGPSLPLTVAAGESVTFQVTFRPDSAKTFAGSLSFNVDRTSGGMKTVTVTGTGIPTTAPSSPTYLLSPSTSTVSFGNVNVGSSSNQTVKFTNVGNSTVNISQVNTAGLGFSTSGITLPLNLAAGQSASLNLAFTPATAGSATGSVSVVSNASNSPATITLSGAGVQPQISVVPGSVSFGSVTDGTTNTQTVMVSNPGSTNLSVSQATVSGTGFGVSGPGLPLTLAPGKSAAFTVSFGPTTTSSSTGSVALVSNAPTSPTKVALSGTGAAASVQLSASPSSLSFGNVNVGSSSSRTVTLSNNGNSTASVSQVAVSGTDFTASGVTTPFNLTAGQSTTFTLQYAPTAAGTDSGNVSITSNATNSPTQLALTGSGVQSSGPLAAFPGAQGAGALSVGGRGGKVYEVTNLNDSGTGSLRACVEASGPRTCVFRTGGTIVLSSSLHILNPYITIAGQTAPGGGIQITNSSTCNVSANCDLIRIGTHDVVVRYLRLRFSSETGSNYSDGLAIQSEAVPVYNTVVDHVSVAWAEWDSMDFYVGFLDNPIHNIYDVAVQYSILAEPNYVTNGASGFVVGCNVTYPQLCDANENIDIHHNFVTGTTHRNPNHAADSGRIINNLIYNTTYYQIKAAAHKDIVGNYIADGPYCCRNTAEIQTWPAASPAPTAAPDLYIAGNAANTNNFDPSANQWTGGLTGITPAPDNSDTVSSPIPATYQRTTPLAPVGVPITVDSALALASATGVLLPAYPNSQGGPGVGASAKLSDTACDGTWVANRDTLDNRYVAEFKTNTGHSGNITGPGTLPSISAGTACASSLHDGIADAWKVKYGLSTTDATLYQRTAPNGYTYLENYLNGTNPTVASNVTSTTSFWAGLTSPKARDRFVHTDCPLFGGETRPFNCSLLHLTFCDRRPSPLRHPAATLQMRLPVLIQIGRS